MLAQLLKTELAGVSFWQSLKETDLTVRDMQAGVHSPMRLPQYLSPSLFPSLKGQAEETPNHPPDCG